MARVVDELFTQRATLCDLLLGRQFRMRAAEELSRALALDDARAQPWTFFEQHELIDKAATLELFAVRSERGEIGWGKRYTRYGYNPDEDA